VLNLPGAGRGALLAQSYILPKTEEGARAEQRLLEMMQAGVRGEPLLATLAGRG
jgi:hypothetical protein